MKRRSRPLACQFHIRQTGKKDSFSRKKHDKNFFISRTWTWRYQPTLSHQVKTTRWENGSLLDDNRLFIMSIQTPTPRRLAVRVIGLADQQSDFWLKILKDLLRIALMQMETSQKRLKDSFVERLDGWWYRIPWSQRVRVTKHEAGKPAKEVLAGVPEVRLLHWPSCQHALGQQQYIRPVHTLIVLLGDEALTLFLGHPFRSCGNVATVSTWSEITNADSMKKTFVPFTIAEAEAAHENEPRLAVPSCHGRYDR